MNRRCFLKMAGASVTLGYLDLTGITCFAREVSSQPIPKYTKEELVGICEQQLPFYISAMKGKVSHAKLPDPATEIKKEFLLLTGEIPYVGPVEHYFPRSLVESVVALSFYRAMKRKGSDVKEAGKVIVDAFRESQKIYSARELEKQGERMFMEQTFAILALAATRSQKKRLPADFVFEFVRGGPNDDFDWGWNFTECAVQKFFKAQGAIGLLPYLCVQTLIVSDLQGTGLKKTTTLFNGNVCDFRYKKGRKVEYPPFLSGIKDEMAL